MRAFAVKKRLSRVCSAPLVFGPGGRASLQAPSLAPAGVPRTPGRNGNGIQVRPASRTENSPPGKQPVDELVDYKPPPAPQPSMM